jgi:hypothetical protein
LTRCIGDEACLISVCAGGDVGCDGAESDV